MKRMKPDTLSWKSERNLAFPYINSTINIVNWVEDDNLEKKKFFNSYILIIMLSKSSFKNQSRHDSVSSDIVFVLSHTPSNNAVLTL